MLKKIRETFELSSEEKEAILNAIYSKRDELSSYRKRYKRRSIKRKKEKSSKELYDSANEGAYFIVFHR